MRLLYPGQLKKFQDDFMSHTRKEPAEPIASIEPSREKTREPGFDGVLDTVMVLWDAVLKNMSFPLQVAYAIRESSGENTTFTMDLHVWYTIVDSLVFMSHIRRVPS
jgi:hypothetical protein